MNKNIGNEYEEKLIEELAANGWWCHLFAYKPEGQPCDVIAIKNNVPLLIDVKHCSERRFSFSNVRPNQRTCFELALQRGNKNCFFVVWFAGAGWRYIHYLTLKRLEKEGAKSIRMEDCPDIEEWTVWS